MNLPIIHKSDFYKVSHPEQYPVGTENILGNLTARSSRLEGVDHIVFFGLQYFLKEYLQTQFADTFFNLDDVAFDRMLAGFKRRVDNALGGNYDPYRWRALRDLGYLPVEIRALPEGALVPLRVPMLTIKNSGPAEFFWVGQWMETLLSDVIWHPITVATIAHQYRLLADKYTNETSDEVDFVPYSCHDFSMRGQTTDLSATVAGMAHLLSFIGTDTIPSIDFLEQYYNADSDKEVIGVSVRATEHSTITATGEEGEFDTIKRLITEVYPTQNVAIVSDSYNLWRVLTDYLPRLKDVIMSRPGKVIIRPDSGDPVEILCGKESTCEVWGCNCREDTPESKGVVQLLYEVFGGSINSKGYIQFDPHIGVVYGDSITPQRFRMINDRLRSNGFASTNWVAGVGSFSYQYVTRDTFGMAFKATAIKRNGQWSAIYKDPITDSGMKKSARGLLAVLPKQTNNSNNTGYIDFSDLYLKEDVSEELEASAWNMLQPVFRNGTLLKDWTLAEIRSRLRSN